MSFLKANRDFTGPFYFSVKTCCQVYPSRATWHFDRLYFYKVRHKEGGCQISLAPRVQRRLCTSSISGLPTTLTGQLRTVRELRAQQHQLTSHIFGVIAPAEFCLFISSVNHKINNFGRHTSARILLSDYVVTHMTQDHCRSLAHGVCWTRFPRSVSLLCASIPT